MASSSVCPPSSDAEFTKSRFKDKVVIVTGGGSGIGRATVERFANDGASVMIFDVNSEAGTAVQDDMQAKGHDVRYWKIDVSDKEQCVHGVDQVAGIYGVVHILVNGVAYFRKNTEKRAKHDGGLGSTTSDWNMQLSVNLLSFSHMVQACHPYMKKAAGTSTHCAIVNIASFLAHQTFSKGSWIYGATKGAIVALTKCMAKDLACDGIRVNSVSPGPTYTPGVSTLMNAKGDYEKFNNIFSDVTMLGRCAEPTEIAATITYLCSRDASFITATDFLVDGGTVSFSRDPKFAQQ